MEEGESEVGPYAVEEVLCLLLEANRFWNSARWVLALGRRQGVTLGLRWADVDLDNEYLTAPGPSASPVRARMSGSLTVRPQGGVLPWQSAGLA